MSKDNKYLFEEVLAERDADIRLYENVINDGNSMVIFIVTTTDEKLIDFYKYLLKNKKQLEFREDPKEQERLDKINHVLKSLADDPAIKEFNRREAEKREEEIAQILERLAEKKRLRNQGPIRKLFNRMKKN